MKSPAELKAVLRRQWQNASVREARLLSGASNWPLRLSIGRPSPREIYRELDKVKRHIEAWRQVGVGQVLWEAVGYRATSTAVEVPVTWQLSKPSQWVEATGEASIRHEFQALATLVEQTAAEFHSLLVRRRSLWLGKPLQEVLQATQLALALSPGCAQGQPLRLLSLVGIDTKFFERHAKLITALLDVRFDGEVSLLGLEAFLGALQEKDHWLLIVDLDGKLLPYNKMRVRAVDLIATPLPGSHLLIVENEACQHHLPAAPDTIAVLGTGFDLNWAEAQWLCTKHVAYWGDIDSWGLLFLATARRAIPHLQPILMSEQVFDEFHHAAVAEPVSAGADTPPGLTPAESRLYHRLLTETRGRLEQEFLPADRVQEQIREWLQS